MGCRVVNLRPAAWRAGADWRFIQALVPVVVGVGAEQPVTTPYLNGSGGDLESGSDFREAQQPLSAQPLVAGLQAVGPA